MWTFRGIILSELEHVKRFSSPLKLIKDIQIDLVLATHDFLKWTLHDSFKAR